MAKISTISGPNLQNSDLAPASGSPSPRSPKQLEEILKNLIKDEVELDVDREKVYQYQWARKAELYWRGNSYVFPMLLGGNNVDYTSTGTLQYNQGPEAQGEANDYVLNVIRGDGQKFIAVLGQREPNVKAQPRRLDDESAVQRARKADTAAAYLRSIWHPGRIQRHLALSLWKNGTTFCYTPWVTDGDRYGVVNEPQIDFKEVELGPALYHCMFCGSDTEQPLAGTPPHCSNPPCQQPFVPSDLQPPGTVNVPYASGMKYYPRGSVQCELGTIFDVTVPFYVRDLAHAPWLWYEFEEHKGKLIKAFPALRDMLGMEEWEGDGSNGISAQGQLARDVASSPTGSYITPRKNRWLYQRFWLRVEMFEMIKDPVARQQLTDQYPEGVKVTLVQGEVVQVSSERLDEVWAMCKPGVSEYIFADPICKDYMGIQDVINDLYNLVIETLERSIPFMLVDPLVMDVVQMSKQRGKPGQIVPAKPGVGARLGDSIVKAPMASVDPQVINWISTIHEAGRELVGVLPAIFGGEAPDNTARAAEMRRNQALQQLNPVWNEMRDMWAAAYTNGCRQLARYSMPDATNLGGPDGGQFEDGEADFTDLLSGGWFFTTEESMPMTWGQKRDLVMFMLQQGPEAWKLFGLEHPLNVQKVQEALGFTDWKVPGVDKRDKVLALIQQLKQAAPLPGQPGPPGPPDPMTGAPGPPGPPGPPQPSIPPDVFEDDHMFTAQVIKEWAQTEEARAIRQSNPQGYANIIAYGAASMQLSGPPPMPPGSPGAGAPGGPPPPGSPDPNAPTGLAVPPPSGGSIPAGPGTGGAPPSAG